MFKAREKCSNAGGKSRGIGWKNLCEKEWDMGKCRRVYSLKSSCNCSVLGAADCHLRGPRFLLNARHHSPMIYSLDSILLLDLMPLRTRTFCISYIIDPSVALRRFPAQGRIRCLCSFDKRVENSVPQKIANSWIWKWMPFPPMLHWI